MMNSTTKKTQISFETRTKVLVRDSYRCVLCGSRNTLQLHHAIPRSHTHESSGNEDNIVTLCAKCHNECHFGKHTKEYRKACIDYLEGIYGKHNID